MHCEGRPQVQCRRDGCAVLFTPRTRWQEFCGDKCRNDHHGAERRKEAIRKAAPKMYAALLTIAEGFDQGADAATLAQAAIKDLKAP